MQIEKTTVNLPTLFTIIAASFGLFFAGSDLIATGVIEAKIYAIDLDMDRDRSVIEMYRFQIENGIGTSQAPSRMASLQDKVEIRMLEKAALEAQL